MGEAMGTDYLHYWKPGTATDVIRRGEALDYAASDQFERLSPGDTLWIASVLEGHLCLVGRISVGEVLERDAAKRRLGQDIWDATRYALSMPTAAERAKRVDLAPVAADIRFLSGSRDRLLLGRGSRVGQQLQTMRRLTPESAQLLQKEWRRGTDKGAARTNQPTHSQTSRDPSEAIVLVENERTATGKFDFWGDVTGETYHFPNQYLGRVLPGRPFIYYRGSRREGGAVGKPDYFGTGVIGTIRRDQSVPDNLPRRSQRWFCELENYVAFSRPVLAKKPDGSYFERIHQNQWGVGVRRLPGDIYSAILREAGVRPEVRQPPPRSSQQSVTVLPTDSPIDSVLEHLSTEAGSDARGGNQARRGRASHSKYIGDVGEELVWDELRRGRLTKKRPRASKWLARDGLTPGWDIECIEAPGQALRIEVKATTALCFPSIEVTANEWAAAEAHGAGYALALVTGCLSGSPRILMIRDPIRFAAAHGIRVEPTGWRLQARAGGETGQ